jgi:hypothetical protein
MLGAFEVVAISDGTAARHLDQILSRPDIAVAEYAADHLPEPVNLSINAYLINTGSHRHYRCTLEAEDSAARPSTATAERWPISKRI